MNSCSGFLVLPCALVSPLFSPLRVHLNYKFFVLKFHESYSILIDNGEGNVNRQ